MLQKRNLLLSVLLVLCAYVLAGAQEAAPRACLNNKCFDDQSGVEFLLPAKWAQKQNALGLWEFGAPDEWLTVRAWSSAGDDLSESVLAAELRKFVAKPLVTNGGVTGMLNGMQVIEDNGTGKMDEKAVEFALTAIKVPKGLFFVLTITTPEGFKNNAGEFRSFFSSLRLREE